MYEEEHVNFVLGRGALGWVATAIGSFVSPICFLKELNLLCYDQK
jgi:hypothetical protein